MDFIINAFANHGTWAWLSVAALLLAAELLTGTTYLLWFSVAAAVTAIMSFAIPGLNTTVEFIIFSIAAFITVLVGTKLLPPNQKLKKNDINAPDERMMGEIVVASEDFQSGLGAVKHNDTRWRALCENANPKIGDSLKITKVDGATLFVSPIE